MPSHRSLFISSSAPPRKTTVSRIFANDLPILNLQVSKAHQCGEVNFSVANLRFLDDVLFTFTIDVLNAGSFL